MNKKSPKKSIVCGGPRKCSKCGHTIGGSLSAWNIHQRSCKKLSNKKYSHNG